MLRLAHGAEQPTAVWTLGTMWTSATSGAQASAVVRLAHSDGRHLEQGATGDGPIDATFKAIELATGVAPRLAKFEVRSVSEGEDAQGEAVVTVEYAERTYRGSSLSTNIIESSARAFLDAINQILASQASGRGAAGRRLTQTTATLGDQP